MSDSPRTSPEAISISFPNVSSAEDADFVAALVAIVQVVYSEAEEGIFIPGYQRTTSTEVARLIRDGQLAVAYLREGMKPVGCIVVRLISPDRGNFGMLALDAAYRGGGVGRQLVLFAESYCRDKGCTVMQLELLVPTTFNHGFKERMQAWYMRMGYRLVQLAQFEQEYPALAPLLAGPAEYRIFEKALT
jgi:GNAT superfamily N-acetyltransferase